MLGLLRFTWSLAIARLPASAFLVVIHGAVLAAFFATWFVRRKSRCANRCGQNRKQNFRVIFHGLVWFAMSRGASEKVMTRFCFGRLESRRDFVDPFLPAMLPRHAELS